MKTIIPIIIAAGVCGLLLTAPSGFSQGALTPPLGAPAPTMKTLDQVEARIIVNAVNTPGDSSDLYVIGQPGSYYLTTNITGVSGKEGIEISANNVTLDLNGFAMQGVLGSVNGILIPGAQTNITVRNGSLSGWSHGLWSMSASSLNIAFERLNVSDTTIYGIVMAGAGVVRDCNCQGNHQDGIVCAGSVIISGCTVGNNGSSGIICERGGIISGCTVGNNGTDGIFMTSGTVSGCNVLSNSSVGIYLSPGTASGCYVSGNFDSGIYVAAAGSEVIGNTCIGNNTSGSGSDGGIFIVASNNRVEDNHVTASGNTGIAVASSPAGLTNNIIIKNSVSGDGANNYSTPAGNDPGPVGAAATATSPWANISH